MDGSIFDDRGPRPGDVGMTPGTEPLPLLPDPHDEVRRQVYEWLMVHNMTVNGVMLGRLMELGVQCYLAGQTV